MSSIFSFSLHLQHRHLKEGDFEDKKSLHAPARSISLRGAAAAAFAGAAEDASDEDEELWKSKDWKDWKKKDWGYTPKNPYTGKPWGEVKNDWCYTIQSQHGCVVEARGACKWSGKNRECSPSLPLTYGEDEEVLVSQVSFDDHGSDYYNGESSSSTSED